MINKCIKDWHAELISLEMQKAKQKLFFIYHLIKLEEDSLANEILRVQISQHLPGLIPECKESLHLPDLFEKKVNGTLSKLAWEKLVTKAILEDEEAKFKKALSSKSKLKDGDKTKERLLYQNEPDKLQSKVQHQVENVGHQVELLYQV
jgi:hypothetical protein